MNALFNNEIFGRAISLNQKLVVILVMGLIVVTGATTQFGIFNTSTKENVTTQFEIFNPPTGEDATNQLDIINSLAGTTAEFGIFTVKGVMCQKGAVQRCFNGRCPNRSWQQKRKLRTKCP